MPDALAQLPPDDAVEQRLRAVRLRLRAASPFFATLLLYARLLPTRTVEVAATDGIDIFYHPEGIMRYDAAAQTGVLLHEVLHAALHHVTRRGRRHPFVWNVAADVVVNGIVRAADFTLPAGALLDDALEMLTVEEVYALLWQQLHPSAGAAAAPVNPSPPPRPGRQPVPPTTLDPRWLRRAYEDWEAARRWVAADLLAARPADAPGAAVALRSPAATEAYWRAARLRAAAVGAAGAGRDPLGHGREAGWALGPRLGWRSLLWRYLVQTPVDFQGFDRRFVGRGLYLDALTGEAVRVAVCLDTSGSVDARLLSEFLAEVRGILRAYPHLELQLWYADAALYGPHALTAADAEVLPAPRGGGGTSFAPFFEAAARQQPAPDVLVYLTDGHGEFPTQPPPGPVLWVVAPGGAAAFPFGEVIRLVE